MVADLLAPDFLCCLRRSTRLYPPIVGPRTDATTPRNALYAQLQTGIAVWSAQFIGETLLQVAADLDDDPADATLPTPLWLAMEHTIYRVAEQRLSSA